jgi:hypothetical protein
MAYPVFTEEADPCQKVKENAVFDPSIRMLVGKKKSKTGMNQLVEVATATFSLLSISVYFFNNSKR